VTERQPKGLQPDRNGSRMPDVPVYELSEVHVRNCVVMPSWESLLHRLPKNATVAEVGVDSGKSSRKILDITQPQRLHLIDIVVHPRVVNAFAPDIARGVVQIHESDSVAALLTLPDNYLDWVFIDGDHSYRGVKRDCDAVRSKVKPGGLIVFDDYIYFDHQAMEPYGVIQVVNELCVLDRWEIVFLALQKEMFCKAAVRRLYGFA